MTANSALLLPQSSTQLIRIKDFVVPWTMPAPFSRDISPWPSQAASCACHLLVLAPVAAVELSLSLSSLVPVSSPLLFLLLLTFSVYRAIRTPRTLTPVPASEPTSWVSPAFSGLLLPFPSLILLLLPSSSSALFPFMIQKLQFTFYPSRQTAKSETEIAI